MLTAPTGAPVERLDAVVRDKALWTVVRVPGAGTELDEAIARRWRRSHPFLQGGQVPLLDHLDPDVYVNDTAEWFADRPWDELVALGTVSEFRGFWMFPAMTELWSGFVDITSRASAARSPRVVAEPRRRSRSPRRQPRTAIHLVE